MVGLPLVATAHAVSMTIVCAMFSFMFYAQARGDTSTPYAVFGWVFQVASSCWALFPYFYPNGLAYDDPPTSVLGGRSSAVTLYLCITAITIVGPGIAGVLMHRRDVFAQRRVPLAVWVLSGFIAAGALLATLAAVPDALPELMTAQQRLTPLAGGAMRGMFAVALVMLLLQVRFVAAGSLLARWLVGFLLVQFTVAVVSLGAERYSANWVLGRSTMLLGDGALLLVLLAGVTAINRSMLQVADHDDLTGALSRTAFVRTVARHLDTRGGARGASALMWLDLDEFRVVNEAQGPAVADAFLRETVRRMREVAGGDSPVVARIGGDDFAVLLPMPNPHDMLFRAHALVDAVGQPFDHGDQRVIVSASVGCVLLDGTVTEAEDAMRMAATAMRVSKRAGGDTASAHSPEMDEQAAAALEMRHRLSVAIRQSAFALHYQPVFDLESGQPIGVEALIRLTDEGMVLSADAFIQHAEASGQIAAIGRIGLQCLAVDAPRIFAAAGNDRFVISVNLSVPQLADPTTIGQLLRPPLSRHKHRIVIEITETFEFTTPGMARENLGMLVAAGYRVAVDDFGAGFSNFAQLQQLGGQFIKLDRSLVHGAGTGHAASRTVLTAALAVANALGSHVLAEGVETDAELAVVRELGIRYVQGYRFSPPLALPDLLATLGAGRPQSV